jgi:lysozyme
MKLTREGLELIKAHEGLRLDAYKCPGGEWTIGYGHTSRAGAPEVTKGMTIDLGEAARILSRDLEKFCGFVEHAVKVELTPNQYSALVSFCFNVGPEQFKKSSVLKVVNAKQFDLVPARLALWNKADGKVMPGLVRRRADEGKLFMKEQANELTVEITPNMNVQPITGKPPLTSTTNMAAVAVGAAGATSTVAQVTTDFNVIKDNIGPNTFAIVLGAVILIGAAWIIYQRVLKSKEDGV